MAVERTFYQDRWNRNKVWEVVKMSGGYYLRQYINGEKSGRGIKTSKKFIRNVGIFDFQKVDGAVVRK